MSTTLANETFASFGVPATLVTALADNGISDPFPIQAATLPDALAGRDLLGPGQTGSGKTLAFAIPTVALLAASTNKRRTNRPRALVLVPTRELANQVSEVFRPLAKTVGLRIMSIYGGVAQGPQVNSLRGGVDIVIACPGRLEDLIQQGHCRLDDVEITVLDEADHMADLGFLPGVRRLLEATPRDGQRLLFSATLDNGVDILVKRFMSNPVVHSLDPEVSPVTTMTHHVFAVTRDDKLAVVRELASGHDRSLLFMRTKHSAKKLAQQLTRSGIPAVDLHGNLSQNARERNLSAFASGSCKVLVATDIAARGIHVDDIALVIHVDPPTEHKAYLHRSGRTARAGAEGIVITMMTPDQVSDVKALTKAAQITPIVTRVAPGHPTTLELAGEPAPHVEPAPMSDAPSTPRMSQGARNARSESTIRANQARKSGRPGGTSSGRPSSDQSWGRPSSPRPPSGGQSAGRPASAGRAASERRNANTTTASAATNNRPSTPSAGRTASNRSTRHRNGA